MNWTRFDKDNPPEEGRYLVVAEINESITEIATADWFACYKYWHVDEYGRVSAITHYMPLPELPNETKSKT